MGVAPVAAVLAAIALCSPGITPTKRRSPTSNAPIVGLFVVGKNGLLYSTAHNASFTMLPAEKFKDIKEPEETLPRGRGHELEWIAACKGGPRAMSNFDYAGPLAEFVLLGNVATQFDGPIEFDPIACKIANNAEADQALRRPTYRKGWEV